MHRILIASLMGTAAFVTGCEPQQASQESLPDAAPTARIPDGKLLDGAFADWGDDEAGFADGRWVWVRFAPGTRPTQAIQAADYTTRVRIDADMNPSTGRSMDVPRSGDEAMAAQPQGVDLLIEYSPANENGGIGIGMGVTSYAADGDDDSIGHAAIGAACLPTYSSEDYELRIDRLAPGSSVLPASGWIDVVTEQVNADGTVLWSDRQSIELPARDAAPGVVDVTLPARPENGVRVMSANVLFSAPLTNPDAFERVLRATDPDVILYQEWFRTEREKVEAWVSEHAGADWALHFPDERAGVAIATRFPIVARYDEALPPSGEGRPARACAALIDTDAGELLAISVHLKCCGGAGSEEDLTRIDQAKAINGFIAWVHEQHPDAMVVIAGDFNLVGSRVPLEVMARGLGVRGDDLAPALTPVLGDSSVVTWVDEKSRFGPGRLDWLLYDDSRSELIDAYMLNTRVLTDEALTRLGLERDDSMASDHLPMVVDLVRLD